MYHKDFPNISCQKIDIHGNSDISSRCLAMYISGTWWKYITVIVTCIGVIGVKQKEDRAYIHIE